MKCKDSERERESVCETAQAHTHIKITADTHRDSQMRVRVRKGHTTHMHAMTTRTHIRTHTTSSDDKVDWRFSHCAHAQRTHSTSIYLEFSFDFIVLSTHRCECCLMTAVIRTTDKANEENRSHNQTRQSKMKMNCNKNMVRIKGISFYFRAQTHYISYILYNVF